VILHDILNNCKLYHIFLEEKLWRFLIPYLHCKDSRDDEICHIIGWGTRQRKPKGRDKEENTEYPIQRLKCKTHSHTISVIPGFLLPRIHYLAALVNQFFERYMKGEYVAAIVKDSQVPDEKTVHRWIRKITSTIDNIKKTALSLLTAGFYTFDERLVSDQKVEYQNSGRSIQLITLWALLKAVAIRLSEGRVPYHYAILQPP